ncbi:MAG: 4-carboxymuconolactone decarboxylase [Dehalococcoidia bacterium]|nr:4-carboxymuconolactone decarboxylase [Dehalococcoidia bacterium]
MPSERFEQGLEVRREVLGAEYVDAALAGVDDFNRDFQEMVTEMAWGTWARAGLERKQRSLNVLCLLAALNRPVEFRLHFRAALGNGCTREELRETLLQITAYAGVPAGVEAFRIAREVLSEVDA